MGARLLADAIDRGLRLPKGDAFAEAGDDAVLHLVAILCVVRDARGEPDVGQTLHVG